MKIRLDDLKSNPWFRVIVAATVLTGLGSFGEYSLVNAAWGAPPNIPALLTFWLLMPGLIVAFGVAGVLSPGGLHNPEPFMWLAVPAAWLFYFGIGALRIHLGLAKGTKTSPDSCDFRQR